MEPPWECKAQKPLFQVPHLRSLPAMDQTCTNSLKQIYQRTTQSPAPKSWFHGLLPESLSQVSQMFTSFNVVIAAGQDKTVKLKRQIPSLPTTEACKPSPITTKHPQYMSTCWHMQLHSSTGKNILQISWWWIQRNLQDDCWVEEGPREEQKEKGEGDGENA